MTPSQLACLEAMELDRWVPRDAAISSEDGYALVVGSGWQVLAPPDEVGAAHVEQPTMKLLSNILKSVDIDPAESSFGTVAESQAEAQSEHTISLAFLGAQSLPGWHALPLLSEMLSKPSSKRQAWEILQNLSA